MSDYTSWHVGMKVVCVDDEIRRLGTTKHFVGSEIIPMAGHVYTIREIGFLYPFPFDNHLVVRLAEIKNKPIRYCGASPYEAAFGVERFRPVQHRKTSIAIFTAMLTNTKVPA